ncbi:MAG: glycosyltransferase involved in cell wall biosynthesis [Oleiphilaceae bacterium]|jgi:glycosyltransferase involved in cell wall biosynthesis
MYKNSNIFIVTEYISSSENTTGFYWEDIANALSSEFGEISVLTTSAVDISPATTISGDIEYIRVSPSSPIKSGYIFKLLSQLMVSFKLMYKVMGHTKKNDLIICGTNPTFLLLLLWFFKPFKKFKWLLCLYDIFPDNLVPAGVVSPRNIFFKLAKFLFRKAYLSADSVVVNGRDMYEYVLNIGVDEKNLSIIEGWYEPKVLNIPEERDISIIKNLGWDDKIIYQFFGNVGAVQDIRNILSAIKYIDRDDVAFLFAGLGSEVSFLKEYIQDNKDANVYYYGAVPQNEKMAFLAACDVSIVSLITGMYGLAVPSKTYFSLAANKPLLVVGDQGAELDLLLRDYPVGWFCQSASPKALAEIINSITVDLVKAKGVSPRQLAINKFSSYKSCASYVSVVKSLFN